MKWPNSSSTEIKTEKHISLTRDPYSGETTAQHLSTHSFLFTITHSTFQVHLQCRKHRRRGYNPWVGMIPWSKEWQPTPVFFPGEIHGQKSLVGSSPKGCKESDMTKWTPPNTHKDIHTHKHKLPKKSKITSPLHVKQALSS